MRLRPLGDIFFVAAVAMAKALSGLAPWLLRCSAMVPLALRAVVPALNDVFFAILCAPCSVLLASCFVLPSPCFFPSPHPWDARVYQVVDDTVTGRDNRLQGTAQGLLIPGVPCHCLKPVRYHTEALEYLFFSQRWPPRPAPL